MKKKLIGLAIISVILAIVTVAYVIVVAKTGGETPTETGGNGSQLIVFINKQENDVSSVTYRTSGSEFTVKRSGSTFVLDGDEDFPLDMNTVRFMINAMAQISFDRRIDPEGNDLEEYGLVDPHTVMTATYRDGGAVELKLGNYNVYSESYYCTVGDGFVYLINSQFAEAFDYDYADLLLDDSVQTPQNGISSVTAIEITENGKTVTLAADENGMWRLTDADGNMSDEDHTARANQIYREFFLLYPEDWVTYSASSDEVRDTYGLKTPEIRVLFKHIEEKSIENEGSATVVIKNELTTAFLIGYVVEGTEDDEHPNRYFMFGDGSIVYTLPESAFSTTLSTRPE